MGYRSTGAIRITGPKDTIWAELGKLNLTQGGNPHFQEALNEFVLNELPDGRLVLGLDYSDWKWYADYPVVQAFKHIWSHFEGVEDVNGSFVRIGEDTSDIEEHIYGEEPWDLASICRSVEAIPVDKADDLRSKIDAQPPQGDPA